MNFLPAASGTVGQLGAAALFGFSLLRPALEGLTPLEKIAWAVGAAVPIEIGATLASILIGGPDPFWLVACGAAVSLLLPRRKIAQPRQPAGMAGGIDALLVAAVAAGLVAFLLIAISEPLWTNDYLAIWGLKAKTIALTRAVSADFLRDPSYAYSHPEYPLGLPLVMAGLSWARWNDHALAIIFPWFGAASVAAIAGFCRRRTSFRGAAVAAALAALFFPLWRASNVGLADIPFTLAAVLLASAFLDVGEDSDWRPIARLALAALLATVLKREGLLLASVFAAAAAAGPRVGRVKRRAVVALMLPAAFVAAAHRLALGPYDDRDFRGASGILFDTGQSFIRVLRVTRTVAVEVPAFAVLGFVAVAIFFIVTPGVSEDRVIPPVLAQLMIYALSCVFYAGDPAFLVHTALGRISSAIIPAVALAVGPRVGLLENRTASAKFRSGA